MGDDADIREWREQLSDLRDQLEVAEGKVVVEKGEDEEAAETAALTNSLADKADADARAAEKASLQEKIAVMKHGLEVGGMNEEDTLFVRTALANFEKKLVDLEVLMNEDGNKARLAEA